MRHLMDVIVGKRKRHVLFLEIKLVSHQYLLKGYCIKVILEQGQYVFKSKQRTFGEIVDC